MFFNRFLRNFLTVSIFASLTELVSMNAIRFPHFCHCVPSGTPEKSTTCALGRHHLFQAWFDQWHARETDQSGASVSAPSCSLTSHHHFVSYLFCVRFRRLLKALFRDNMRSIISIVVLVQVWGLFYHEREISLESFQ